MSNALEAWSDLDSEYPRPPLLSRRDRALAELAAEVLSETIAVRLIPTFEGAAAQQPETDSTPFQSLIFGPNSSDGADSVYEVSADAALWPLSVICTLTTSAVVADRTVAVEYRTGDGERFVVAGTQAAVQASGQQSFCWHPEAGDVAWPVEDAAIAPLPQQHLYPGQQLALKVWNGQAGDVLDQVRISARFDPLPQHDRPTRSEHSLEGTAVNGPIPVGQEARSR